MKERNPARLEQLPLDQDHAEEDASDDAMLGGDPVQLVHPSVEHLHGPEEVAYEADELVVVCLVRDGRPYVKSFVEHYFSLGVKHIVFLDNGSVDGTVSAALNYDNVTILQTDLPFKEHKNSMRQYLVARFGRGRWILYVDIDELFDYPYSDVVGLDSLLRYLNERSYTAVVAQMLDMFPKEPLLDRAGNPDEPLKELHRFYDISNVQRKGIREHRPTRNNIYEGDDIEAFDSGIRNTLFGTKPFLTKHPLIFSDGTVTPFDGSSHWVDNARVADLTCVLFHYKFLDEYFHKKAASAVREQPWNDSSYKKYREALDSNLNLQSKQETVRELRSVNELVGNQFLVVSEEYMMLVYEEEERKKGAGLAPRGGEPRGPEEEAAFHRARAQAKVQGLRARRLERRLQDLAEQNQRQLEKLREQYERRIEKLYRRLARIKKKTKKENRVLTDQLQRTRASSSWRLLNKLARLRVRVLGRKR